MRDYIKEKLLNEHLAFYCYRDEIPDIINKKQKDKVDFYDFPDKEKSHNFEINEVENLEHASKKNTAKVSFLDDEALRLMFAHPPKHSSYFVVRLRLDKNIFFALFGFINRLISKELKFKKIMSFDSKKGVQYWVLLKNLNKYSLKKQTSFSVSRKVGIGGLVDYLNENSLNYVFLDHNEDLEKKELNILISDEDELHLKRFLGKNSGSVPVKVRSASTTNRIPYYPPPLARKILLDSTKDSRSISRPKSKIDLLSYIYYCLYHKGYKSGIPSSLNKSNYKKKSDSFCVKRIKKKARKLGVELKIQMEALDEYLFQNGWRPRLDMLSELALNNEWIWERFFKNRKTEMKGVGVFILKKKAVDQDLTQDIIRYIEKCNFIVVKKKRFSKKQKKYLKRNLRGGNWKTENGKKENYYPELALVVIDNISHPFFQANFSKINLEKYKVNKRIKALKKSLREKFDKTSVSSESFIHSTDNCLEAQEYLDICFPEDRDKIRKRIIKIKEEKRITIIEKFLIYINILFFNVLDLRKKIVFLKNKIKKKLVKIVLN